jgi:hypothetical protein
MLGIAGVAGAAGTGGVRQALDAEFLFSLKDMTPRDQRPPENTRSIIKWPCPGNQ